MHTPLRLQEQEEDLSLDQISLQPPAKIADSVSNKRSIFAAAVDTYSNHPRRMIVRVFGHIFTNKFFQKILGER